MTAELAEGWSADPAAYQAGATDSPGQSICTRLDAVQVVVTAEAEGRSVEVTWDRAPGQPFDR